MIQDANNSQTKTERRDQKRRQGRKRHCRHHVNIISVRAGEQKKQVGLPHKASPIVSCTCEGERKQMRKTIGKTIWRK